MKTKKIKRRGRSCYDNPNNCFKYTKSKKYITHKRGFKKNIIGGDGEYRMKPEMVGRYIKARTINNGDEFLGSTEYIYLVESYNSKNDEYTLFLPVYKSRKVCKANKIKFLGFFECIKPKYSVNELVYLNEIDYYQDSKPEGMYKIVEVIDYCSNITYNTVFQSNNNIKRQIIESDINVQKTQQQKNNQLKQPIYKVGDLCVYTGNEYKMESYYGKKCIITEIYVPTNSGDIQYTIKFNDTRTHTVYKSEISLLETVKDEYRQQITNYNHQIEEFTEKVSEINKKLEYLETPMRI